jgi:hypothetical protein
VNERVWTSIGGCRQIALTAPDSGLID